MQTLLGLLLKKNGSRELPLNGINSLKKTTYVKYTDTMPARILKLSSRIKSKGGSTKYRTFFVINKNLNFQLLATSIFTSP
jgi:hypothetical protein